MRHVKQRNCSIPGSRHIAFFFQGSGSSVIAGGQTLEISRGEIDEIVLNGFFPILPWETATQLKRKSALSSMGLPYEADPAITKQLAAFYASHCKRERLENKENGPDYVLFNGGSFKPDSFRKAILTSLRTWFSCSSY